MNKILSIGIDCRMAKESGIGRYISNIIRNIALFDTTNKYTLYVYEKDYFSNDNLPQNFKIIHAPFRWHTFSEQFAFNSLIKKENHDIMHFPQTNYPIFYDKKFVITVHDLTMVKLATGRASTLFYPFYLLKLFFFKLILKSALHKSVKIITVSNFVKNEIVKEYKIASDKIEVIYNGIDSHLSYLPENADFFNKNYSISKPFIFYVGNAYPHKNLDRLILAFTSFNIHNKYELVLAGKSDFFYERMIQNYKNLTNIRFIGELTDEELSRFYSSCEFFVYPSLSEGFGIQIVEALGLNAKVCCSNNSVFPEIALNYSIYFNPYDIEDMAKSFDRTIESPKKITNAEIVSLREKYNWKLSAQIHHKLYETA